MKPHRIFKPLFFALLFAAAMATIDAAARAGEVTIPPTHILAGGAPLDVQREGHSAPFAGDFDGDGVFDLLVGQYEGGKLRIYRNLGTNAAPRFDGYEWFQAGGQDGRVPEG